MRGNGLKAAPSRQSGLVAWTFALSLCLLAALGAALVYSNSALLPAAWAEGWTIRWLQVDGPFKRVNAEQVRAAVRPHTQGGFFQVDLDVVQAAIEALPWVSRAVARKRWPDVIHVRVLEHDPVARWGDKALIDRQGELFRVPEGGAIKGLAVINSNRARLNDVINRFKELRELLVGTGLSLRGLTLTERGTWHMQVDPGIEVRLGAGDVDARLKRFTDVYKRYFAPRARELKSVDLRYTNGFAVEWEKADGSTDS